MFPGRDSRSQKVNGKAGFTQENVETQARGEAQECVFYLTFKRAEPESAPTQTGRVGRICSCSRDSAGGWAATTAVPQSSGPPGSCRELCGMQDVVGAQTQARRPQAESWSCQPSRGKG